MRQVLWDSRMSGDPKTLCIKTEQRRHSFAFYIINTKRYKSKLNLNTCSKKEREKNLFPQRSLTLCWMQRLMGRCACVCYITAHCNPYITPSTAGRSRSSKRCFLWVISTNGPWLCVFVSRVSGPGSVLCVCESSNTSVYNI